MKNINKKTNFSMTSCTKTGIKIKNANNDYKADPFANVNPFANQAREVERVDVTYDKTKYESLDLNIENYSREELYKLFGFRKDANFAYVNLFW